ncbi:MAG: EAL domain-containing protein [Candidatus Sedimenticola sp. PURPLELP]
MTALNGLQLEPGSLMFGEYDIAAVILSVMIAVMAAYAAIELVVDLPTASSRRRQLRLAGGAAILGFGIWSMHFVGMLAFKLPVPVSYDVPITLLSIVPAWVGTGIAFYLLSRKETGPFSLVVAAFLIGIAIASMHYTGMAAMCLQATVKYQWSLFFASIAVAVIASYTALLLVISLRYKRETSLWVKQLAAALLGSAVAATHYIGVSAIEFRWSDIAVDQSEGLLLADLDWMFAGIAILFFSIVLIFSSRDRYSKGGVSLSSKTAAIAALLVAVSTAGVGFVTYSYVGDILLQEEIEEQGQAVRGDIRELSSMMGSLGEDVRFMSRLPQLRAFLEKRAHYFLQGEDEGVDIAHLSKGLDALFQHFIASRPRYMQVRLVGVADGGREVIRVDQHAGEIVLVDKHVLQQKAGEPYFEKSLSLARGDVYFSNVDLNREFGKIAEPRTWVLRASSPVFSSSGEPLGFFIINVNFSELFRELLSSTEVDGGKAGYILGQGGRILMSRDPRLDEQAGDSPGYFHQLYRDTGDIFAGEHEQDLFFRRVNSGGEFFALSIHKLNLSPVDSSRFIAVAEALPYEDLERQILPIRNQLLLIVMVLALLSAFLGSFLVRIVISPLLRVTRAAEDFAAGNQVLEMLPSGKGGEIGALANSFRSMVEQVNEREFALKSSERLVREVLAKAGEGIITTDNRGVIETFNQAAEQIFGYERDEVVGFNVTILMPDAYRASHNAKIRTHLENPNLGLIGRSREVEGLRKSGEVFPLEIVVTELVDYRGHKFVSLMRDVTARKKAEENLRLAAQVMDSSLEAIVITDANERIRAVNPAFSDVTGYSSEEVVGKTPAMFASGRHDKAFYDSMWQAITNTGKWQGEVWDRRKNGEVYPKWLSISAIKNDNGEVSHYVGIASDITELKLSEQRLEHMAHYDPLTKLPNRMLLQDRLDHSIAQCRRSNSQLALLFVDLDRFKAVNDSYGHEIGDQLLVEVAVRLKRCVREGDTIARLGGDEFVIIISNLADPSDALRVAEHLVISLREPFHIQRNECFVGSSIGIAIFPGDGGNSETLSRNADTAMYRAKEQGGDKYSLYDDQMGDEASRRLLLDTRLRHAMERGQLAMHYQPIISGFDNRVVAVEALMRWYEPEFGSITPSEFIPLAEDSGMIGSMGRWALGTSCKQFRQWREQGIELSRISVNVSPRQLLQPDLPEYISDLLKEHGLEPDNLELELTETAVMEYSDSAARFFDTIERLGVRLSIDDFGTGYSSLAYIKQLPIHTLKIDRSFVRDLHRDVDSREIVRAVTGLAHNLGLDVVAEGVSEPGQLEYLKGLNCDLMQGWLYSRAVDADTLSSLLSDGDKIEPTTQ